MNLLTDPLFRVQTTRGRTAVSLPGLLEALGENVVHHLVGIQRHQEDAFHVFLCQLAAVVLARQCETDPAQTEDFWRDGLRRLARHTRGYAGHDRGDDIGDHAGNGDVDDHGRDAADDAWTLVVEDVSRPAFMQPPLPRDHADKLKPVAPIPNSPDALDLLPTAKNHDVKRARASEALPDNWIYSLVSLQTMSGFFGRGNPGISRMNSGFGSRLIVEVTRTVRLGQRWTDAVTRLLDHRREVLTGPYGFDENGLTLVWLVPWNGESSLSLSELDPCYVEICRRVRLSAADGTIVAATAPANAVRIAAGQLRGVVGDAWLPIDVSDDDKALTISAQGLTADILRRIVFHDGLLMTTMHKPLRSWTGNMWMRASVLVRGQGTTDGFHERSVLIPPHVQPRLFGGLGPQEPLSTVARDAIQSAGLFQRSVLRPAVFMYLQGAPDRLKFDTESSEWWTRSGRRFESLWSQEYFPWLWSLPESFDQEQALTHWATLLRDHGLTVLREVYASMPVHEGRRWRSRSMSERRFWGALYHHFPQLKEVQHEHGAS